MIYNNFKELEKAYSVPFSQEKYMEALTILNDGIGHWYPEDLNDKLVQAMDFILK